MSRDSNLMQKLFKVRNLRDFVEMGWHDIATYKSRLQYMPALHLTLLLCRCEVQGPAFPLDALRRRFHILNNAFTSFNDVVRKLLCVNLITWYQLTVRRLARPVFVTFLLHILCLCCRDVSRTTLHRTTASPSRLSRFYLNYVSFSVTSPLLIGRR